MKKGLVVLLLVLATYVAPIRAVEAAEEEKPLAAGWLSLDNSVGVADRWIALNKAAVEDAIGIGISGYFDTSYTWSSHHAEESLQNQRSIFLWGPKQSQF